MVRGSKGRDQGNNWAWPGKARGVTRGSKGAWSGEARGVAREAMAHDQGNNWAWSGEIRMWDKRSTWQTQTETEPCAQTQNKH